MKKSRMIAITSFVLILSLGISAFAASDSFTDKTLPAKQGDTEVSTVGRASASNVNKHFTITITSLDEGYTAVRAWTEGSWGGNYSGPYDEVSLDKKEDINYTTVPDKGDNVTLNLDNPVYTTKTVKVSGNWTPN